LATGVHKFRTPGTGELSDKGNEMPYDAKFELDSLRHADPMKFVA